MKKFKKAVAGFLAVVSMVTCVAGMRSSAAYYPTITKNFIVGNSTATAVAYRDSSHATASTKLSGGRCDVKLKYCGKTASYSNYINATPTAMITGSRGTASTEHRASKGGFSNSTSLVV